MYRVKYGTSEISPKKNQQDSPPAWPQEAYCPRSLHFWTLTGPPQTLTQTQTLTWTLTRGAPPDLDQGGPQDLDQGAPELDLDQGGPPDLDQGASWPWPGAPRTLTRASQTLTWTLTRGPPQTLTWTLTRGAARLWPGGPQTLTRGEGPPRPWLRPWPGGPGPGPWPGEPPTWTLTGGPRTLTLTGWGIGPWLGAPQTLTGGPPRPWPGAPQTLTQDLTRGAPRPWPGGPPDLDSDLDLGAPWTLTWTLTRGPPCGQTEILKTLPSLKLRLRVVITTLEGWTQGFEDWKF